MDEIILEEGKRFLISYLKGQKIGYETLHPWRNSWEFVVLHSLRVEGYVKKIIDGEKRGLSRDEVILTRLAAILHDVGRIHKKEGHALAGRNIVENWLMNNKGMAVRIGDTERLLKLIEQHSDKYGDDSDYCLNILRDADVLDEIGAISIFMASNWIDRSDPYFFQLLSDRIEDFEIGFCDKGFKLLKTETAKAILNEKREFITLFNSQLKNELYGTEMFRKLKIEEL